MPEPPKNEKDAPDIDGLEVILKAHSRDKPVDDDVTQRDPARPPRPAGAGIPRTPQAGDDRRWSVQPIDPTPRSSHDAGCELRPRGSPTLEASQVASFNSFDWDCQT